MAGQVLQDSSIIDEGIDLSDEIKEGSDKGLKGRSGVKETHPPLTALTPSCTFDLLKGFM